MVINMILKKDKPAEKKTKTKPKTDSPSLES